MSCESTLLFGNNINYTKALLLTFCVFFGGGRGWGWGGVIGIDRLISFKPYDKLGNGTDTPCNTKYQYCIRKVTVVFNICYTDTA